ncbi:hypothetical protein N0V90_012425 [Kalmusia sp. IMI 367209]|nr:hypothetical protein N0V90_012425 [Kalmusia sp. IMI 367209]
MAPSNTAAWQTGKRVGTLEVKSAPYTPAGKSEVVIRAHAVAINIIDAIIQAMGDMVFNWIKYPFVLGDDVAGEVVEVGPGVTRFKTGDRVVGHAVSLDKRSNRACEGAFQQYVVLREHLVSPIPESLPYENACVLPLTCSTAACGLFQKDYLALRHPSAKTAKNATGETLLVWGGSTSLGSNAIQLAVAAGYEVIATASPKNFEYVKDLGASMVFDYRSPTAIADITTALKSKKSIGAIAIGDGSLEACIPIIGAAGGRKFIAQASLPQPKSLPPKGFELVSFIATFLWFNVSTSVKCRLRGVSAKFINGSDLMANEVGAAIYEHFLPEALASGKYVAAPKPQVIGHGLEYVQEGLNLVKKGVSNSKLVVNL